MITCKIFCDLDGTIGQFDEHAFKLFGKLPRDMEDAELWDHVDANPTFWTHMPPKPYAHEMWKFIVDTGLPFAVLTGCPKRNYDIAAAHKVAWIKEHFGDAEVITCLSKNKPDHMVNKGDILIDDFIVNVRRWEKAGGIAIKHYDGHRTIEKLKIILDDKKTQSLSKSKPAGRSQPDKERIKRLSMTTYKLRGEMYIYKDFVHAIDAFVEKEIGFIHLQKNRRKKGPLSDRTLEDRIGLLQAELFKIIKKLKAQKTN